MFIGHYAVGLASRKISKFPSLAMMFIAVELLDLIWPVLCLLGIERFQIEEGITKMTPLNFTFYPYSHSLLMAVVWGALLGIIYFLTTRNRRGSLLLAALVLSHWVLDFVTHRPDLPLSPFTEEKYGLSLWNYPVLETFIEVTLFLAGAIIYFNAQKPNKKISYWILVAVLLIIHVMNLFGPAPPSTNAVMWSANLMWLFVIWAWWIEKK